MLRNQHGNAQSPYHGIHDGGRTTGPAALTPGELAANRADYVGDILAHPLNEKNDHLSAVQLRNIRNAVRKVTIKAQDYEVLYAFYDYYSGLFGSKIKVMDAKEEAKARTQGHETDPNSDTKLRPDVLEDSFDSARLGSLLLRAHPYGSPIELHGLDGLQEGQSYAVEYFTAEKSRGHGPDARDHRLHQLRVRRHGQSEVGAARYVQAIAYAVMTSLQQLSKTEVALPNPAGSHQR